MSKNIFSNDEDTSITDNVFDNLSEWSSLVTELSSKEIDLYYLKEDIFKKEQDIIKKTDFNTLMVQIIKMFAKSILME